MEKFMIRITEPYHFKQMAHRLLSYEKTTYRERNGMLLRTLRLGGEPYLLGVQWDESEKQLAVSVMGDMEPERSEEMARLVRYMFSTDVDLTGLYNHVSKDEGLRPLMDQLIGTRMVREPDLFESLVKTIIGQQVNMAFAGTLTTRLLELAGDTLTVDGESWLVFPTPEQVARLDYEQLQQLQFNRRKAEYVIDLARKVVSGELDLDGLWHMSDEQVTETLIRLRGIGRWTVECLLLFGLGRPNLLPAADIGLRNAVRNVYGLDRQPTEAEVREVGSAWSPWCSYVTLYLWESLSLPQGAVCHTSQNSIT